MIKPKERLNTRDSAANGARPILPIDHAPHAHLSNNIVDKGRHNNNSLTRECWSIRPNKKHLAIGYMRKAGDDD